MYKRVEMDSNESTESQKEADNVLADQISRLSLGNHVAVVKI